MKTKKRWEAIYPKENPFKLPQAIAKGLKECVRSREHEQGKAGEPVKYLWIYIGDDGSAPQGETGTMSVEDWLNVLDESATLGVNTVIIEVRSDLSQNQGIWRICHWAQETHGMSVGLHIFGDRLAEDAVSEIRQLDLEKTRVYVDREYEDAFRYLEPLGIRLQVADSSDHTKQQHTCHLPESMTCVGTEGALYTCGLVLGNENYRLGNVFEVRLDDVMKDESLPHIIPEGIDRDKRRCDACPPLMEERLQGKSHCH
ncbi:MAG: hypothetical protein HY706_21740 [Candidatus Hydrogenedentes bacterium]|nr:hypothetical protein [Candidatus Hydrogenedentota bacterium]